MASCQSVNVGPILHRFRNIWRWEYRGIEIPGVYLDFLTRGISVVLGCGHVRGEDLNLSAILMYIVSMISSI